MRTVFRLLLLLYPAGFRRRYAVELVESFDAEREDPRHQGVAGSLRLWRFVVADLFRSAARQRAVRIAAAVRMLMGTGEPRLPRRSRRSHMEMLLQDVRYAFRQFTTRPGFSAVAVLSLALGIGGTSLVVGLLDGYVFNPFPYPDSNRLVAIGVTFPKVSAETTYIEALSTPEYLDIERSRSFSSIATFDLGNRNISGGDVPERVFTALVLDDLFPVMGMQPHLGRGFTPEELAPKGPNVAVVSHRLWQSRLGSDPGIIGRSIRIGGEATTVVGVMPKELVLIGTDLWIPWGADPASQPRNARQFNVLARLAPGVSLDAANAELSLIAAQVQAAEGAAFKEYEGWRLTATPFAAALLQDVRPAAFVLLGAVALVLLIACANLTNLMLARATTRQRELAVRLALGAGRARVIRQLLTESLLLGAAGTAAGVLLAYVGLQFASALIPPMFTSLGLHAGVNARVLAWSGVLGVLAAIAVTILPALQAMHTDPQDSLKSDSRSGQARTSIRARQALIVAEISLSVVLLLASGLLMRSFFEMQRVDLGFQANGLLTMRLTLPQQKYPTNAAVTAFFEELIRRVGAVPGVSGTAMASQFPPLAFSSNQIEVEGLAPEGTTLPTAFTTIASRGYFETMGIPLIRGRLFAASDRPGGPALVIVNKTFVSRYLKDREPVGARMRLRGRGAPGPFADIIGVVGDTRNTGVGAPPQPEAFIAMEQGRGAWNQLYLVVRSELDEAALVPSLRAVVASIDPDQPVYNIQTMSEAVALSSFQQRVSATLIGVFAAIALVLAAIGIYGVMSYSVSARTQEIGVRMAMGAERGHVIRLVLLQVARLVLLGLAIGVALLVVAGGALSTLLYGVTSSDPLTMALVTMILGAVALLAGLVPAWRASRVNPIHALRYE